MKTIVEYDVKGDTSGMIRCYPKNNKLVKFKDIVLDNLESYSDYHKSSYSLWEKYDEFIDKVLENYSLDIDLEKLTKELNSDIYTVTDIIKELKNPGLDPRSEAPETILRSDILTIDDLSIGMELKGTVRNVASFGAFVDIGLHDDGLLHISKMSKNFVKDPKDIVSVGDILTVYISDIDKSKGKVQLSLIK